MDTNTYFTSRTGRTYWIDEKGIAVLDDQPDPPDHESEMRAEFQMSWVCGGGRPEDGAAAWAQGVGMEVFPR